MAKAGSIGGPGVSGDRQGGTVSRSQLRSVFGQLRTSLYARVTVAYAATAFVLLQLADLLFDDLLLPPSSKLLLLALLVIGFPIAIAIAWAVAPAPRNRPRRNARATAHPSQLSSLAVLPFVDLSPGGDHQYLGDGLTEELLSSLSGISGLRVPARTSSYAAKAGGGDIRQIGRELAVEAVLEGSVRSEEKQLRISVQLIEVESGFQIWSHIFQAELTSIFEVQESIARGILQALKIRLPADDVSQARTPDPQAYDAYLKGRHCWHRGSQQSLETAVDLFQQAAKIDPGYADAYSGLADALVALGNQTYLDPKIAYARARAAAQKAVQLDDRMADAHASLGLIAFVHDWDFEEAEAQFRQAVELDTGSVGAHHHYARFLCAKADFNTALDHAQIALDIDPLSVAANVLMAVVHRCAGHHEQGIALLEQSRVLFPEEFRVTYALAFGFAYAGRLSEAVEAAEKAAQIGGRSVFALGSLGYVKARAGEVDAARDILVELKEAAAKQYVCPFDIALIHVALGDVDDAMGWLDRAYAVRDHALLFIKVDAGLDPMRHELRFAELEQKVWPSPGSD